MMGKTIEQKRSKNAQSERHKWTKAEREYVKGIIHNYTFQRWTAQEIVQWLHDEKKIDIGRVRLIVSRTKWIGKQKSGTSN